MSVIDWDHIFRALVRLLQEDADAPAPAVAEAAKERRDPFRVLVATVISLRTKDEVTGAAARRLLGRAGTPEALAEMPKDEIARLIYPAGFYNTKAAQLKRTAHLLLERHGGKVPADMDALLALPGVGRKTANLVRNEGYGLPGICVDTHVHRISNRFGWVATGTPAETEKALEEILPRKYWIPINRLLVGFGQRICTPVSPRCSTCALESHCLKRGVGKHR
jgi:endonuclease-3